MTTSTLTAQERFDLITRNTDEVLTAGDLMALLEADEPIRHYIGFEISGKIHLGTGLMCMGKIKDFMDAGVTCTIFLADWHTWINDKLGGNREVIKRMASSYFAEGLKASLLSLGGDPSKLNVILGSDLYHDNPDHWSTLIEVSKNTSLARMQRSITILGRKEGDNVDFAKLIYPPLQVADIFTMRISLAHAGSDQRKAQVIARDVALQLKVNPLRNSQGKIIKPVAIHHHLLLGLRKPASWPPPAENRQDFWAQMKMSKSDPNSAIFIHDSADDIRKKINKAFCPPEERDFNPILDWAKYVVFRRPGDELRIDRTEANGGPVTFATWDELADAYVSGALHPMDLKAGVAQCLIDLLEPARRHFAEPVHAAALAEMDALMKG